MTRIPCGFALIAALGVLLTAGCEPQAPAGTIVRGKIYKGGAPLKSDVGETGIMEVKLYPTFEGGYQDESEIGEDGSFEFIGQGNGVPPGKYKIGVEVRAEIDGPDQLKGKFLERTTPIVREIKSDGEQDLGVIDLDNPQG